MMRHVFRLDTEDLREKNDFLQVLMSRFESLS